MPVSNSISDPRRWRAAGLTLMLMTVPAALANEPPSWGFVLPTLEGERFVRSADLPGPVLVNFWSKDCPPCVRELPRLETFARDNPQWTVILIATDTPQQAKVFLTRQGIALTTLRGGADVTGSMRGAGNRSGGLPFSVVLDDGKICETRLGELDETVLRDWQRQPCYPQEPHI
ncbi:MAG: TlpA family protein disulfide reductase [Xanthomonadaceae bacterium]|jgi:outer membrane receptor for ferrienterochelin and colicins|nr:TlpA family protein disulfide reductase [Xanthomonadaceae bacterium]